jgi:GntR family transcriptional regulator, transcriptional repressor for pyruvate dehydrogenase complex
VAARVRELIFSKEVKVGQKFPSEHELAGRLQVSRVVIREALRSLEQSGLVEIKAGSTGGAYVVNNLHKPLFDWMYDLFNGGGLTLDHFVEARRALECAGVRLAATIAAPEAIEAISEINEQMIADPKDKMRFKNYHTSFHTTLGHLSGNPVIRLMVLSLFELLKRQHPDDFFQTPKFMKDTYKRHRAIIEAMKKKDVVLCEQLMVRDVEQTRALRQFGPKRPEGSGRRK